MNKRWNLGFIRIQLDYSEGGLKRECWVYRTADVAVRDDDWMGSRKQKNRVIIPFKKQTTSQKVKKRDFRVK